ncbi:3537_t:CDS:2, partial [Racocetra persica]
NQEESLTSGSLNTMIELSKKTKESIKRKILTGLQKQALCIKARDNPNYTLSVLATEFGIKPNTVHDILAEKDTWLILEKDSPLANSKRRCTVGFLTIESALVLWVEHAIRNEQTLSGWVMNFKKCYHLNEFVRQVEANSALLEDLPHYRKELQQLIQSYPRENVFNCDETALFYYLEPTKILVQGPVTGQKKAKDRITLMLTVSSIGEKLTPLMIHKYKNPRPLNGINKNTLPQTGILPDGTDVNVDNETIQSIEQSTNSELLMLINKFSLGIEENRIELDEFINLDNYIAANKMPSMKSIIETVERKESSEPDLSLIQHISYKSALEYIESLF